MAAIAFLVEPPADWDMRLHFLWMDEIRNSELTLTEFLFKNEGGVGLFEYRPLIFFNLIRYLISKLTPNNHWLPCVCTFLDYLICGYIAIDWSHTNGFHDRSSLISPFLCLAFLPFYLVVSGIRTALASALAGLAIYLYLYKKKTLALLIILMFLAITTHQVVIFTLPFVFMSKLKMTKWGLLFVFFFSLFINTIAPYAANSKYYFIAIIAQKFLTSSTIGTPYALITDIVLVIAFLLLFFLFRIPFQRILVIGEKKNIYVFLIYFMSFILCNFGNYDLVVRPAYLLGVFAPILSTMLENKTIWKSINSLQLQNTGKLLCIILCSCMMYVNIFPVIRVLFETK